MPFNINRFDPSALAALAGNAAPNLNLPLHGITGGDALKEMNAQTNANRGLDINQQQVDQQGKYQEGQLAINQAELGLKNKQLSQEDRKLDLLRLKEEHDQMVALGKEKLQKIAGVTSSIIMGFGQVDKDKTKTPEQKAQIKEQIRQATLDAAVSDGSITPQEHDKYAKMPIDQFGQVSSYLLNHSLTGLDKLNAKDAYDFSNSSNTTGQLTDTDKRIAGVNNARVAAGQAPLSTQEVAKIQETGLNTSISPGRTQLSPSSQVTVQVTTDVLKKGQDEAAVAKNMLKKLSALQQLDQSGKVEAGALGEFNVGAKKGAAAVAELFGVPMDAGTSTSEAFDAIAKDLQLDVQTKLKGSTSNTDLTTVGKTAPQLSNTKEGRQLMYNWGAAVQTSKVEYENFRNAYAEQNNGSLVGSDRAWDAFINSKNHVNPKTGKFNLDSYGNWDSYLDPQNLPKSAPTSSISPEDARAELQRRAQLRGQ